MSAHHPECPRNHGDAFPCGCAAFAIEDPHWLNTYGCEERATELKAKMAAQLDATALKIEARITALSKADGRS